MRKWFILLFAFMLVFPSSASAQGTIILDSLKVRLWSEHDQPSMLVIYDFTLTADSSVPGEVEIRIPKDGNITAVAYEDAGELLLADFDGPADEANWQVITVKVQARTGYHIEYYQPLERNGNLRKFNYQWAGEYPVNDFSVEIQVPDDSTSVKTSPAIPLVRNQPFLSGGAMMSGLDAGQTYQLQLEYSRANDAIPATPPSAQVEPSAPLDANTDGRVTLDNLPYILGGFGAVLILAALYYSWRVNSFQLPKPRRRRREAQESSSQTYCHQCGARAQTGDRFCRTCGSKLRAE
jgi:hypothetical protein